MTFQDISFNQVWNPPRLCTRHKRSKILFTLYITDTTEVYFSFHNPSAKWPTKGIWDLKFNIFGGLFLDQRIPLDYCILSTYFLCVSSKLDCPPTHSLPLLVWTQESWRLSGHYIVVLKEETLKSQILQTVKRLQARAAKHGYMTKILHIFEELIQGFVVKMSSDVLHMVSSIQTWLSTC